MFLYHVFLLYTLSALIYCIQNIFLIQPLTSERFMVSLRSSVTNVSIVVANDAALLVVSKVFNSCCASFKPLFLNIFSNGGINIALILKMH